MPAWRQRPPFVPTRSSRRASRPAVHFSPRVSVRGHSLTTSRGPRGDRPGTPRQSCFLEEACSFYCTVSRRTGTEPPEHMSMHAARSLSRYAPPTPQCRDPECHFGDAAASLHIITLVRCRLVSRRGVLSLCSSWSPLAMGCGASKDPARPDPRARCKCMVRKVLPRQARSRQSTRRLLSRLRVHLGKRPGTPTAGAHHREMGSGQLLATYLLTSPAPGRR